MKPDPAQEQEWLGQSNLIYGALIAIGVVMIQPFLATPPRDLAGEICVIAFAVAIPLLAALILVNRQETFRRRRTTSKLVVVAQSVAQGGAFTGLVAGFWHITWIAGVVVLASGVVAVGVHSAGYYRLERDRLLSRKPDGDTEM